MTTVPSRRKFLQSAAAAAAGVTIVPRHVLGGTGYQAPSDTFNVAAVGVGGMGRSNLTALASQNIVALCDVDFGYVDRKYADLSSQLEQARKQIATLKANPNAPPPQGPGRAMTPAARLEAAERRAANVEALIAKAGKAKRYQDYRQMLAEQKDIDGVLVATPDHTHAAVAMAAMSLGKHVYVQKPLCWSVHEARALAKKAAETKVATQMGNQGHSLDDARKAIEYIQGGYIGDVTEVHIWTNRPHSYWPQGLPRPAAAPVEDKWATRDIASRLANAMAGNFAVPQGMAWDLFLGPAPVVPYHPVYHPGQWRGWVDWGQGALGDMGAHLVDHPFWALELGMPTTIETVSTPFNGVCYPTATMTHYQFAARGSKPAVKLTWYDGGFKPPRPEETRRDAARRGRRRALHRQQGQADARHVRRQPAPAAAVAARQRRHAEADAAAHRDQPRDELGRGGEGQDAGVVPVRVRREAHRGHAARHRVAARRNEDPLRRRQHAGDQLREGERLPPARVPHRLDPVGIA